jgi:hypothetical protein
MAAKVRAAQGGPAGAERAHRAARAQPAPTARATYFFQRSDGVTAGRSTARFAPVAGGAPPAGEAAPGWLQDEVRLQRDRGRPLPEGERERLERGLAADLRPVRIHVDPAAARLAALLGSDAFTSGEHVFFAAGRYSIDTAAGRRLIAQELRHVLQQRAAASTTAASPVAPTTSGAGPEAGRPAPATSVPDTTAPSTPVPSIPAGTTTAAPTTASAGPLLPGSAVTAEPGRDEGPGEAADDAHADAAAEAPAELPAPASPDEDPAFQQTMTQVAKTKRKQRDHEPEADKVSEVEQARLLPTTEQQARSDRMEHLKAIGEQAEQTPDRAKLFTPETFKALLRENLQEIAAKLPKSESAAKRFKREKPLEATKQKIGNQIDAKSQEVAAPLAREAKVPTPTSEVKTQEPGEISPEPAGRQPAPISSEAAAPKPRADFEISMEAESRSLDDTMAEHNLTEDQLAQSNEPTFAKALDTKRQAQAEAAAAPGHYREQEQAQLDAAHRKAAAAGRAGFGGMYGTRETTFTAVLGQKDTAAAQGKSQQSKAFSGLQHIYDTTRKNVEQTLTYLTETVDQTFESEAGEAKKTFESRVEDKIDDIYGVTVIDDWLFGADTEAIERVFVEEQARFLDSMERTLDTIANIIAKWLNNALGWIAWGRRESQSLFDGLSQQEQKDAKAALDFFTTQYDMLEDGVNDKQRELANALAESYTANVNSLRESFDKIKDEVSKGWIGKAVEFVVEVGTVIAKLAELLWDVLSRLAHLISDIISHPIRFLENLGAGIAAGFSAFIGAIDVELASGFFRWLSGASSRLEIKIPDKFDLPGLFSMAAQVLGLSYETFKEVAQRKFGRKVVELIEGGAEAAGPVLEMFGIVREKGLLGLWEHIKGLLAAQVDEIYKKAKEAVIYAAIKKALQFIASLFTPAGAFIKAVQLLYRGLRFLMDNIDRIRELVNAFLDSLELAVAGQVDAIKQKIILALRSLIVLAIDALAKLLGLGDLAQKVKGILKALRSPVIRAIGWLLDKLRPLVMPLIRGVQRGVKYVKTAAGKVVAKGKAGVAKVRAKLVAWWKARKSFVADDGLTHSVYLARSQKSIRLMVASEEGPYSSFITKVAQEPGLTPAMKKGLKNAQAVAQRIDAETVKPFPSGLSDAQRERAERAKEKRLNGLLAELAKHTKPLFGTALPASKVDYGKLNAAGFGTNMSAKVLTKGADTGSPPSQAAHATYDTLNMRRHRSGRASYYVRGHLLNENLGGKGEWTNMTPLSRTGNKDHEAQFESIVKAAVNAGAIVEYHVKPVYDPRADRATLAKEARKRHSAAEAADIAKIVAAEDHVPKGLTCEMYRLEKSGRDSFTRTATAQKWTILNTVERDINSYFAGEGPGIFPININEASEDLLQQIPGIQPKQAKNIHQVVRKRDRPFGVYEVMAAEVKDPDLATLSRWNREGYIVLGRS